MLTTVIGAFPKPSFLKITDWFNASGGTYIFMAFSESSFVNSNGVPTNAR